MLEGLQWVPIAVRIETKVLNVANKALYHLAHSDISLLISQHLFFCPLRSVHLAFLQELSALCSFSSQSLCTCCSFSQNVLPSLLLNSRLMW